MMGLIQAYPVPGELSFLAIDYLDVSQWNAPVMQQLPALGPHHLPSIPPTCLTLYCLLGPLHSAHFHSSFSFLLTLSAIFLREVFPDVASKVRLPVICSRNALCFSSQCSLRSYNIIDTHLSCRVISVRAAVGWSWFLGHFQSLAGSRCLMNAG